VFKSGIGSASGEIDEVLDSLGGWEQLQITVNAKNLAFSSLSYTLEFDLGFEKVWHCKIQATLFYFDVSINGYHQIIVLMSDIKSYIEKTTKLSLSF
jgi:hypothetical protein